MLSHRIAGYQSHLRGMQWEKSLEEIFKLLNQKEICTWLKTPEPIKKLRHIKSNQWEVAIEGQGRADYILIFQGNAIMIEAKQSEKDRWSFSMLQEHQAIALDEWEKYGGIGIIILWLCWQGWAIPWKNLSNIWWKWSKSRGRVNKGEASLSLEDCRRLEAIKIEANEKWLIDLVRRYQHD